MESNFSIILTTEQKNEIRKIHSKFGIKDEPYNNYLSLKARKIFLEKLFDEILINPRENNYCEIIEQILKSTNQKGSIQQKCRGTRLVIMGVLKPFISQNDYIILDQITNTQNSIFSSIDEKKVENIENNVDISKEIKIENNQQQQQKQELKQDKKDKYNYIDNEKSDESDNDEDINDTINIDFKDIIEKIPLLYELCEELQNPQNKQTLSYLIILLCTGLRSIDFRRISDIEDIDNAKNELTIISRFKGEKEQKQHIIKVLILTAQQIADLIIYLQQENKIFHYNGQLKHFHILSLNDMLSMYFREKNFFEKYFKTMHKTRKLYAELMNYIHNNGKKEDIVYMQGILGHKSLDSTIIYRNLYKNVSVKKEEPEIQEKHEKIIKIQEQKMCDFCQQMKNKKNFNQHQITCEIKHKNLELTNKQFLCQICKTVQNILNKNQHIKICNKKYNIE